MKYYSYRQSKIYVFILTLRNTSNWRKHNVEQNIINNPNINICYGIDGYDKNLIQNLLKSYNIQLSEIERDKIEREHLREGKKLWRLTNYGKLGRWLSTLMLMKYSIDMKYNIIIIEDDILLPPNFLLISLSAN